MPINNKTKDILKIKIYVLGAQLARSEERQRFKLCNCASAVAIQDMLKYNEPGSLWRRAVTQWRRQRGVVPCCEIRACLRLIG